MTISHIGGRGADKPKVRKKVNALITEKSCYIRMQSSPYGVPAHRFIFWQRKVTGWPFRMSEKAAAFFRPHIFALTVRDLLFRAKYLFVAAINDIPGGCVRAKLL
jgi:hypothetical protein